MSWEVSSNGLAWSELTGASSLRRSRISAGVDTFSCSFRGATQLTAADPFTHGSLLQVRRGGDLVFSGRVANLPRVGDSRGEARELTLHGPWRDLEDCTYQQTWKTRSADGETELNVVKSRVVLFQGSDGSRITTGAQIEDAVSYAISLGANLQLGTVDPGVALPFDERENMKCSEVIVSCLRLLPDMVCWFDYSTSPPTFHCRKRSSLSTASVTMTGKRKLSATARHDLQVPGVVIQYEKTNNIDGNTFQSVETDSAGNTTALRTVHAVFDLAGRQRSYLKAEVETDDIPDPLSGDKAFLKSQLPWLNEIDDADLTIVSAARGSASPLPRMLVEGVLPDWTNKDTEEEVLEWVINFDIKDGTVVTESRKNVKVTSTITATDATSKTYKTLASSDTGEETPTGVAAALFAAWGTLWHEGQFSEVLEECPLTLRPGMRLNITGGPSELASMAAPIQQVDEEFDSGTTTVRFGPPKRLEADSLVALFRGLRSRRYSMSRAQKTDSEDEGDNAINQGGIPPAKNTASGGGETTRLVLRGSDGTYDHEIDLNPAGTSFADAAQATTITTREMKVLVEESGALVAKTVQVLCSVPYGSSLTVIPNGSNDDFVMLDGSGNHKAVTGGACSS